MDVRCCGSSKVKLESRSNPIPPVLVVFTHPWCVRFAPTLLRLYLRWCCRVCCLAVLSLSLFSFLFLSLTFSSTLFPPIGIGSLDTTTALKRVQSTTAVTTRSKTTTAMASITGRRRWYVISSSPSLAPSVMLPYSNIYICVYVCVY